MTIVCWDGETLASDSRICSGTTIVDDRHKKIFKISGEYEGDSLLAIGLSGVVSQWGYVIQQLKSGEPFDQDHEVSAIVIGKLYSYNVEAGQRFLGQYSKKIQLVVGSGQDFALSAMRLGLNAEQAVKHTIKHDASCGGRLQTWSDK
jgi:ATP-dependent protease HslVU (ClpYQ) peptidase subunit